MARESSERNHSLQRECGLVSRLFGSLLAIDAALPVANIAHHCVAGGRDGAAANDHVERDQ